MSFETKKLQVTQQQLDLLESALQTQIKILSVEAQTGATAAKERLNETKSVLVQVNAQRCSERRARPVSGWFRQSLHIS